MNEAHCGTNANNSPAEVDRNAKSDDVDEGYCYSPEQGLQTIDGQLQGSSPAMEHDGGTLPTPTSPAETDIRTDRHPNLYLGPCWSWQV